MAVRGNDPTTRLAVQPHDDRGDLDAGQQRAGAGDRRARARRGRVDPRDRRADETAPRSRTFRLLREQDLGHLDRVERGALAQVVAGDPEIDRSGLRRVFAHAADEHRVDAGGVERRRVTVAVVDQPHAGRVAQISTASAFDIGRWNRTLADTAWPTYTGTRTQVTVQRMSSSWRILRVSRIIFHSSDV